MRRKVRGDSTAEAIFLLHRYLQLKEPIDGIKWFGVFIDSIEEFPHLCRDDDQPPARCAARA
jgi:hypothetical protein